MTESVMAQPKEEPTGRGPMKLVLWKNTLILGFGWLLHFMGLFPMLTVQSSLNSNEGLGTLSLSVQTAFSIFTCLFVCTGVIRRLGTKWTITFGSLASVPYIACNFYPTWSTLVPSASLAGVGSSLMWTAHTTYLTKLTKCYALQAGADVHNVTMRFFGVFFALFYSSSIFGNVASSLILGLASSSVDDVNSTVPYDVLGTCGAQYCNEELGTNFNSKDFQTSGVWNGSGNWSSHSRRPDTQRVYSLCAFCLISVMLSSILLGVFLDSLPILGITERSSEGEEEKKSPYKLLVATFMNLKNPKQLLLLPLTFYNGMDNYFLNTDFTKAFITCPIGLKYIGVITACSGACSLASSFIGGWFNTKQTRWVPFALAALTHLIPAIILLHWSPPQNETIFQYVLASAWGIGSGVFSAQLGAYYGIVFGDNLEPAVANLVLWNSVALTLLYGLSHLLCIYIKIYLILGILIAGMIGFASVEAWTLVQEHQLKKQQMNKSLSLATIIKHSDSTVSVCNG